MSLKCKISAFFFFFLGSHSNCGSVDQNKIAICYEQGNQSFSVHDPALPPSAKEVVIVEEEDVKVEIARDPNHLLFC
jgi:hypothetical protein